MLEKNLYALRCDEKIVISSEEDIEKLSKDISAINYDVTSDYPVDFRNPLLEKLDTKFPDVKIYCRHFWETDTYKEWPRAKFNWRTKKAFINTARSLKVLSKCTRLKVCCLIVKNNRIISTGVNGTPKGFKNCSEVFSPTQRLTKGYYSLHHQFSEDYEVHAEMNAVLELGKNMSIDSYENFELFCSTCPCPGCAKMIAQAGIKKVYYAEAYDRLPEGAKHLQEFGIEVFQL